MKNLILIIFLMLSFTACGARYADHRSKIIQHKDYAFVIAYCSSPQHCYNGFERQCFNGYKIVFEPKPYDDYATTVNGDKIYFYWWSKAKCFGVIKKQKNKANMNEYYQRAIQESNDLVERGNE